MAEFFGAWGSTPGNTIIAGLNALKNKIPDFIGDIKEEAKIRKAINKDIAELDKLDRDEKNGIKKDYFKERSELADRALRKYGYDITSATQMYSADKQLEGIKIASASRENASSNKGGFKSVQDAENALDKHITEGNKIGSQYSTDKAVVKARKEAYDADKLDAKQKTQYEAALKTVTNFENREKELRDNVNFFKQNKGMNTGTTSSAGASSGVDLNNYWKK
jgi:hypothetical protein